MPQSWQNERPLDEAIDLLVDGELSDDEFRALIQELDVAEDGWRRCSLAFIEAQQWSLATRAKQEPRAKQKTLVSADRIAPTAVMADRKLGQNLIGLALIAATLLAGAFCVGAFCVGRWSKLDIARDHKETLPHAVEDGSQNRDENRVVGLSSHSVADPNGLDSDSNTAWVSTEVNDSLPRQLVAEGPGGGGEQLLIPVVNVGTTTSE
jgi:hypothetical protein